MFLYTRTRRFAALLASFIFASLMIGLYLQRAHLASSVHPLLRDSASKVLSSLPTSGAGKYFVGSTDTTSFWPQFFSALVSASPRCALPRPPVLASTPRHIPYGDPIERQDLIHLDEPDEVELRDAHAWFVAQITAPTFPRPHFVEGSTGIVTAAGGQWLPVCLVSLRMLRRTGSTLPVEVFLATPEEAEADICDTVMPMLGARCRILSDLLDAADGNLPRRLNVTHFQLKAFAMLFSEFDNIFWMDSDQMPVSDPRLFLESEPFLSFGLVTWPDYWAETISPAFFRIAGIPSERVPVAGWSGASEAAQLIVSKSKHLQTLELATYYNLYGPSHYYELIGQNAYGTGDKDTFQAAALVLDAPLYKVKTPLQTLGYHDEANEWMPMGILQANPTLDQIHFGDGENHAGFDYVWPEEQFTLERVSTRVPPAFLHAEQSKPNAELKVREWLESSPIRAYQPFEEVVQAFGFDVERTIWDQMVWTACGEELHGHVFHGWVEDWEAMLNKEPEKKFGAGKRADAEFEKRRETEDGAESMLRRRADGQVSSGPASMDICGKIKALYTILFHESY